jgi:DNA-binding transcriptional MerR regulator
LTFEPGRSRTVVGMSTLTIGQVAERTGFSTSALRYYEGIGLVAPAARTDAGYRLYDEGTIGRMAFIARAKQLGCTLEEITDLVGVWQGERCGPVQRRLHELVTVKIDETQRRLDQLTTFAGQLRAAAAQLSAEPLDGPCDDGCACVAPPTEDRGPGSIPIAVATTRPADDVPVACTLPAEGFEARTEEWRAVLAHVADRSSTPDGGLRLAFDAGVPTVELVRVLEAEQACCRFFTFTLTLDASGIVLEVRAPADGQEMVAALFGMAA